MLVGTFFLTWPVASVPIFCKDLSRSLTIWKPQTDGNIEIRAAGGDLVWDSDSTGTCSSDCRLVLDKDGFLKMQYRISPGRIKTVWTISDEVCACMRVPVVLFSRRSSFYCPARPANHTTLQVLSKRVNYHSTCT